ncbi:MAG: hypothetical protein LBK00_09505 [Treponema sp.]|jgi:hypothetical protein|nr:hypothetical protein [Treponema sp.]
MTADDFSDDELRFIKAAILTASAQSDTEEFENEKRLLDHMHIAPNNPAYDHLLDKIQDATDRRFGRSQ